MMRIAQMYRSTLGKKAVVAVTGLVLFGFIVLHMLGNLKTFTGNDAHGVPHIDVYAHFLRTVGEPAIPYGFALWIVRIVLIVSVVLHLVTVLDLALKNRRARPVAYRQHVYREATIPARMMLISGSLILGFVIVHILQFTTGTIQLTPVLPEQVYRNLYEAFHVWFVALFYIAAMSMVAVHLYHGIWSMFQTLGLDNPDRNRMLRWVATVCAVAVFAGFCSLPVMFVFGLMPSPPDAGALGDAASTGGR